MPDKIKDDKKNKSLVERALEAMVGKENMDIDLVVRKRGVMFDTYTDDKGNVAKDGPFALDGIICINGATPTDAQVQTAINRLRATEPNTPGSNSLFFQGVNPIAAACSIAAKPAKGR